MHCKLCKERIEKLNMRNLFMCTECTKNHIWEKEYYAQNRKCIRYVKDTYFECEVVPGPMVGSWIEKVIRDDNICSVTQKDGSKIVAFPEMVKNNYLYGYLDVFKEGDENQLHEKSEETIRIPFYKMEKLERKRITEDFCEANPPMPMYGYKAMHVIDGKISDNYEIGVPKTMEKMGNFYEVNYQDTYFHYCESIEDPLLTWDRDYISSFVNYNGEKGISHICLYYVKAEEHYRKNTEHGWVTNHITLIEEISPQEIIRYYEEHSDILGKVKKYLKKHSDIDMWEKFKEKASKE